MRMLQTTDDDRRQRLLLVWPTYTMCRRASNNISKVIQWTNKNNNKYIGPSCYRAELYAGCVSCCPSGESRWVWKRDRQTDGRTPYCYITLSAGRFQRDNRTTYDRKT